MINLISQVQAIAKYRVSIKRQLRLKEIVFNNEASTETLEVLLKSLEVLAENEVWVVFDKFSPTPGLRCKATKVVNTYTEKRDGRNGLQDCTYESISYQIGDQFYGEEFFVA